MKKAISILCILALILSLAACGASPKADTVVKKYMDALKSFDFETIKSCTTFGSELDLGDVDTEEEYAELYQFIKDCAAKMTYTVTNIAENGDKSTVDVDVNYIDASPVVLDAISNYISKAFALALSGASDDALNQVIKQSFSDSIANVATGTDSAKLKFDCIKKDGKWLIDNIDGDLENIASSNIVKAFENISSDDTGSDEASNVNYDTFIDVPLGQTAELATIKITVTGCEETQSIGSKYMNTTADEGTKFIVYTLKIENTTKQTLTIDDDEFYFIDNQEREYDPYEDEYWYMDDTFNYTDLAPSMPKTGHIVYHVPADCEGYVIMMGKSGTTECYVFHAE